MLDQSFQAGDGAPGSPAYGFLSSPNTGIYRDGAGLAIVVGGVLAARITGGGGVLPGNGPVQVTGAGLAVTVNAPSAVVTTESLATAAGSTFTYVVTNSVINANSNVQVTVGYGSATAGLPMLQKVVPGAGTVSITVLNLSATSPAGASFNGTLKLGILVQ